VFRLIALLLMIPLLLNMLPLVPCSPPNVGAGISDREDALSEVPDCCKHGMCPMHVQQKSELGVTGDEKCRCAISSRDSVMLTGVVQAPAILNGDGIGIELIALAAAERTPVQRPLCPDLPLDPPPPRS